MYYIHWSLKSSSYINIEEFIIYLPLLKYHLNMEIKLEIFARVISSKSRRSFAYFSFFLDLERIQVHHHSAICATKVACIPLFFKVVNLCNDVDFSITV